MPNNGTIQCPKCESVSLNALWSILYSSLGTGEGGGGTRQIACELINLIQIN